MIRKNLKIENIRKADLTADMFGLYFEDTNYSDDGGIYAEMIENRAFEYVGEQTEERTERASGGTGRLYGWHAYPLGGISAELRIDTEDPVDPVYPHYLNFTSTVGQLGFMNKAYHGITLRKGVSYKISCYIRTREEYEGTVEVGIFKDGVERSSALLAGHVYPDWRKYDAILELTEDIDGGEFVIMLSYIGNVDFDMISMVPEDAVVGVFRKDLVDYLARLNPKFLRFPIGYNYHSRRKNVGAFEYLQLCEYLDVQPIPVINVGLWDTDTTSDSLEGYIRSALAFIEFTKGPADSEHGATRAREGHPKPFQLNILKIGCSPHETDKPEYLERYAVFEQAIHAKYPLMKLIGSTGSAFDSEYGRQALEYFRSKQLENPHFTYAVDLDQVVSQEWLSKNHDVFATLPKELQYSFCARAGKESAYTDVNTLKRALDMAGFMTTIEKNADVICMTNHSPVIARVDYNRAAHTLVRFDDTRVYGTPSFYVKRMYGAHKADYTMLSSMDETEGGKPVYHSVTYRASDDIIYIKIANPNPEPCVISISGDQRLYRGDFRITRTVLHHDDLSARNTLTEPLNVALVKDIYDADDVRELEVEPYSFTLFRIEM